MLITEVLLLGMSTGVLLFSGLGALATGFMMLTGLLPETWLAGIASVGISAGIITALLWRTLKRLQVHSVSGSDQSSDLIGLELVLENEIQVHAPDKIRYSGIDWRVEIDMTAGVESIAAGERVSVASVDVGVLRVKPTSIESRKGAPGK
ncbi:NfeD family protein [Nitrosomonas cryotolerans]|nr:NfeD family protein [Nitrosomonas cryotolerans]